MPRRARNDDLANADLARNRRGVQRTSSAIGNEREASGIETALRRDPFDRIGHLGRGDAQYPDSGLGRAQPERLRYAHCHGAFRGRDIKLHLAAKEAIGAEAAQYQIGVGDCRFRAAAAVARGPRFCAGAPRSDMQCAAMFDTRNGSAAGTDFENINGGNLDGQRPVVTADQRMALSSAPCHRE